MKKKFMTVFMSVVMMLTCLCSCSRTKETPQTSIVYVGPNGEVLEQPYQPASKRTKETEDDDEKDEDDETEPENDAEAEIDEAIDKAEKLLSEGKNNEAMVALIEVRNRYPENKRIREEVERINSLKPVDIFSLDYFSYTDDEDLEIIRWPAGKKTNSGVSGTGLGCTTHSQLSLCSYPGRTHGVQSVDFSYYINGQYNQISGLFCLGAENVNTPMSISLNIYSDEVLIYSSEEITRGSLPIPVSVDLPSGSQVIKIEFVSSTTNLPEGISTSTQYSAALINAVFKNKYEPLK